MENLFEKLNKIIDGVLSKTKSLQDKFKEIFKIAELLKIPKSSIDSLILNEFSSLFKGVESAEVSTEMEEEETPAEQEQEKELSEEDYQLSEGDPSEFLFDEKTMEPPSMVCRRKTRKTKAKKAKTMRGSQKTAYSRKKVHIKFSRSFDPITERIGTKIPTEFRNAFLRQKTPTFIIFGGATHKMEGWDISYIINKIILKDDDDKKMVYGKSAYLTQGECSANEAVTDKYNNILYYVNFRTVERKNTFLIRALQYMYHTTNIQYRIEYSGGHVIES